MFFAAGITSMGDALCGPADIALFAEAERLGDLKLRLNAMLAVDHYEKLHDLGVRTGFGNTRLRIGGIKSFVDGAIGGRTCLLAEPFEGTDYHGMQTTPTDELRDIVRRNQSDGNRLCVHCNGDRALEILLDAFEKAADEFPRPGLRHRIEHCSVVNEDIMQRIKRLDACAIPFAGYVAYHGSKLIEWYGEKRLERMFAHSWFLREGITVAGSSDYPCGPFEPLYGIQSMVTRRADDGPGARRKSVRESRRGACDLHARLRRSRRRPRNQRPPCARISRRFRPLEDDPLTAAPSRIASIPIRATYVGAERVWSSD